MSTSSLRYVARSLLWASVLSMIVGAAYVDNLSFGHKGNLSPDLATVPGWRISGEGHMPTVMSDRIILTPPYPGNKRGAVWSADPNPLSDWAVEFNFRASGPERSSGNLQVWYTKESQTQSAVSSLYTVGKFDGLVLVIDQYGRRGGSIRGFLNDGSVSFKDRHDVDSMSFGHCDYAYRNLGRLTNVRFTQGQDYFKVEVDDRECFKTDKIKLPAGYYFGVTAATGETPDSFEAHKFMLSTVESGSKRDEASSSPNNAETSQKKVDASTDSSGAKGSPASDTKLAELAERLHSLNTQMSSVVEDLARTRATIEQVSLERHKELLNAVSSIPQQINNLDHRVQAIERVVIKIQSDIEGRDYQELLSRVHFAVKDTHASLLETIPDRMSHIVSSSAPRMWYFVFAIIAFQVVLLGSYVIYKRRRKNMPKKFL